MAKPVDRFSQILIRAFKKVFGSAIRSQADVSRSAPCPCGSGLKYKRCCLPKERQQRKRAAAR